MKNMATKEAKKTKVEATPKKEVKKTVKKVAVKKEAVKKEVAEVKQPKETKKTLMVTVEDLFEAGAHFGHVVKKWNPKMKKYLWGEKNGIHIFDLEKTVEGLNAACRELTKAAAEGKRIVIVGTKRQAKQMLETEAKRVGVPYITQRWMGGLITNWKQVKQTMERLNSLKLKRDQGQLKKFTKKEQVLFDKEIARLERVVGGIATLKDSPEVVIGLVDSNANPDLVDFIIPMNDDSAKALEIVISAFGKALEVGLKERKDLSVNIKPNDGSN
jgi:small subunit ribosomal protein S2